MVFSLSAAPFTHAASLPFQAGQLVTPNTLTVAGSSAVGPIAYEEIYQGDFVSYWNALVAAGTVSSSVIFQVNLAMLGSGTAIPALAGTNGVADVGELARPPSVAEWTNPAMTNMQIWPVGIDSVAIVLSPDMSWFVPCLAAQGVTGLTTLQVAQLFADSSPQTTEANQGLTGATGSTPMFTTWAQFFTAQGWTIPSQYVTQATGPIQRAVRDPTSGTFDCFNKYFVVPNGYQFENKTVTSQSFGVSTVVGTQEMAPFTYCEQNIDIVNSVSTGTNYVGFISLGFLQSYGGPQTQLPQPQR